MQAHDPQMFWFFSLPGVEEEEALDWDPFSLCVGRSKAVGVKGGHIDRWTDRQIY